MGWYTLQLPGLQQDSLVGKERCGARCLSTYERRSSALAFTRPGFRVLKRH
jgi:hypothetical protein